MKRTGLMLPIALPGCLLAGEASAIAFRHDVDFDLYTDFGHESQFQAAGTLVWGNGQPNTYGICGAVLIAPDMVLTAAHCVWNKLDRIDEIQFATVQPSSAQFAVESNGSVSAYSGNVASISLHPIVEAGGFGNSIDLAIVHLSEPITGVEPIKLLDRASLIGERGAWVGGGSVKDGHGNNNDARVRDGDAYDSFQGAENRIDVYWNSGLGTDFDNPDSDEHDGWNLGYPDPYPLEGDARSGDSGSPFFAQLHGQWYLAGVVSGGGDYGERGIPYGDGSWMASWVSPLDESTLPANRIQTQVDTREWMLAQGVQFVTVPAILGDSDLDNDVDDADLAQSFANYTGPGGTGKNPTDGDYDGDVDDADLAISFANYTGPLGPNPGPAAPEPTSLALLGLGGLMIERRRRA